MSSQFHCLFYPKIRIDLTSVVHFSLLDIDLLLYLLCFWLWFVHTHLICQENLSLHLGTSSQEVKNKMSRAWSVVSKLGWCLGVEEIRGRSPSPGLTLGGYPTCDPWLWSICSCCRNPQCNLCPQPCSAITRPHGTLSPEKEQKLVFGWISTIVLSSA